MVLQVLNFLFMQSLQLRNFLLQIFLWAQLLVIGLTLVFVDTGLHILLLYLKRPICLLILLLIPFTLFFALVLLSLSVTLLFLAGLHILIYK